MKKYFISKDNIQKGPFSIEELKEQEITKSTLVWFEGCEGWVEAGTEETLSSIIKLSPPPIPTNEDESDSVEVEKKKMQAAKEISTNFTILKKSFFATIIFYIVFSLTIGGFQGIIYKINSDVWDMHNEAQYKINEKVISLAKKQDNTRGFFYNENSYILVTNTYYLSMEPKYRELSDGTYETTMVTRPEWYKDYQEKLKMYQDENRVTIRFVGGPGSGINEESFRYADIIPTINNIIKFSFGYNSIKKSLLFFLILSSLWIGGRYTLKAYRKSKSWVEKYSKPEE